MTTFSRETELSFHRRAAEQEARLVTNLEHILSMLVTNRKHYDEIQERFLDKLQHRLERRHSFAVHLMNVDDLLKRPEALLEGAD